MTRAGRWFNEHCEAFLAQYTRRNTLSGFLRQKGNVVQTMLGSSVRKGTYATGLSDDESLLTVNQSSRIQRGAGSVRVLGGRRAPVLRSCG